MKLSQPIAWIIGLVLAVPATAVPDVWFGTIAAHTIACSTASVGYSDAEAVVQAGQTFASRWPEARLAELGAMFTINAETPEAIIFCAQYFGGKEPLPEGLVLRSVLESPGLFAYCPLTEWESCVARFTELLGDMWQGERWLRSRFGWVIPGRESPELIPEHTEFERIATTPDSPMLLPNAESELQLVGKLVVARLTEEDANRIRAELTRPPAVPDPGKEPLLPEGPPERFFRPGS